MAVMKRANSILAVTVSFPSCIKTLIKLILGEKGPENKTAATIIGLIQIYGKTILEILCTIWSSHLKKDVELERKE